MPRRASVLATALFAVLVGAAPLAPAARAEEEVGRLTLATERVVVFKDGWCLVVKRAAGTSNAAGEVFTEEVPDAAVLGTFWATADPGAGRLLSVTAASKETSEATSATVPCTQFLEVLAENRGKAAVIDLDDATTLRGTVKEVLAREERQPEPWAGTHRSSLPLALVGQPTRETTALLGSLFVLGTDEGDVVLPVARIRKLTMKDTKLDRERKVTEKRTAKRLTVRFEGGAAARSLHVLYFRPGVRWIPTYRIDLPTSAGGAGATKRAAIRLQAEILNEAEDLVDVPIDVVVGVPNFRFRDVVSPLVLEGAMRNALREAAPQLMSQQVLASNAFSNRAGEWRGGASGADTGSESAIRLPEELTASRTQDLFTYSLPRMTLRKGERAAVPVFDADVPYRDVYTWDAQVVRRDVEASPSGGGVSPLTLSDQRVWHQIELTNGTAVPWTTGAAMVLQGTQPLAQELLTYTSAGASVRVPVTVAIDVRAAFSEEETGRQSNALNWLRDAYARIEKKGRLEVASFKDEAVVVEVTCGLGGRADSATEGGTISLGAFRREDWTEYTGHPGANNHSTVTFTLRVPAKGTVAPEIVYHYFTRQ